MRSSILFTAVLAFLSMGANASDISTSPSSSPVLQKRLWTEIAGGAVLATGAGLYYNAHRVKKGVKRLDAEVQDLEEQVEQMRQRNSRADCGVRLERRQFGLGMGAIGVGLGTGAVVKQVRSSKRKTALLERKQVALDALECYAAARRTSPRRRLPAKFCDGKMCRKPARE